MAEAARKAREQKKTQTKPVKVYTNDNIPKAGFISTVGPEEIPKEQGAGGTAASAAAKKGENYWRKRFADARSTLRRDQQALEVEQRELAELMKQYYPDPQKALMQQYTRDDINKKQADIDAKQKEIEADQKAISDLEDELRAAGGDPGWARE